MDEFKSNSHKSKENQKNTSTKKRVDGKVISGSAKIKKKSDIRKFTDIFIAEDLQSVKDYILWDVLIPYAKDTIEDIIHVMLRGKDNVSSRRKTAGSRISYGRYYEKNERREYESNRARPAFDYGDIIFESRGDAEVVLMAMDEALQKFGVVSVGDLYDLAEVSTTNYAVNKYGWTDIHSATVVGNPRDGYRIKLPRALPLDY